MENIFQVAKEDASRTLMALVAASSDSKASDWLAQQVAAIAVADAGKKMRKLYLAFGAAPRFVGKALVQPGEILEQAKALRRGFDPSRWTTDQVARVCLLLQIPFSDEKAYISQLNRLFETADMEEQTAAYLALPLLPHPERLTARASEGIRTNMTIVLDAVTLDNPYPADFLDEGAWNQLVLKALFTEREIYRIVNADKRANAHLARMLSDYAHERWAAGRNVTPELWRFTGKFLHEQLLADLEKLLDEGTALEKHAAVLACLDSDQEIAQALLNKHTSLAEQVKNDALTWDMLGKAFHEAKLKPQGNAYQQAGSGYSTRLEEE